MTFTADRTMPISSDIHSYDAEFHAFARRSKNERICDTLSESADRDFAETGPSGFRTPKLSLSKLFSLANRCYDRGSMLMKNNKQLF